MLCPHSPIYRGKEGGGCRPALPGELGGKHLPHFPINRGRCEEEIRSTLLVSKNHLKLVRKIVSVKKIQAEALPRRFRGRFREGFPPFFVVLRSSTGKFPKSNFLFHSMYPWWSPFVSCTFILVFIYFLYPLLMCFSHLFKSFIA